VIPNGCRGLCAPTSQPRVDWAAWRPSSQRAGPPRRRRGHV